MPFYDLHEIGQVGYTGGMALLTYLLGFLEVGFRSLGRLFVPTVSAQNAWDFNINVCTLFSGTAPCVNLPTVQGNLFNFFILAAFEVCTGVFLLGCLYLVLSGGSQTLLDKGKNIIRYSLIAYAIIGGSFIILRAMTWLLYSG